MSRRICTGHHPDCIWDAECQTLAHEMDELFSTGRYDYPASILHWWSPDAWRHEHRTARKRAHRAERLGYTVEQIDREDYTDDIHAVNTSLPARQGRPMSQGYRERPEFTPLPVYLCPRHYIQAFGCFAGDGTLVAYLVLYVSGDLAMVSQILGHGDHMENDVMYLLVRDVLATVPLPSIVFYNRHDSGTDGLRYFKERLGFQPERVSWAA